MYGCARPAASGTLTVQLDNPAEMCYFIVSINRDSGFSPDYVTLETTVNSVNSLSGYVAAGGSGVVFTAENRTSVTTSGDFTDGPYIRRNRSDYRSSICLLHNNPTAGTKTQNYSNLGSSGLNGGIVVSWN